MAGIELCEAANKSAQIISTHLKKSATYRKTKQIWHV